MEGDVLVHASKHYPDKGIVRTLWVAWLDWVRASKAQIRLITM